MINFLKTTRRALPLALALIGAAASAQSVSVSVYVTDTRLLTIPAVNVPGEGSYQAQLMLEGGDSGLREGRILTVAQLIPEGRAFKLPVAYLFNEPIMAIPGLAVKMSDGRVSYFDVILRKNTHVEPLKFIVASMVETIGGQSGAKGETGPQGPAGPSGGPIGPAGPAGSAGPAGVAGPAGAAGSTGLTGAAGAAGAAGLAGTAGADGKTVLNGAVDPVPGVGTNGDFYFNTATSTIFGPKAGGAWPAGVLLKGAAGAAGAAGVDGATGPAGSAGATGPAGSTGATGPAGSAGATGSTGPAGSAGPAGVAGAAGSTGPAGSAGPAGAAGPAGPAGGGMMTGSSSSTVALTSVLGGLASTQSVLPLYGYVGIAPTVVNVLGGAIALSVGTYAMAQPFPVNTTLTKIQAMVGVSVAAVNLGFTKVSATLYRLPAAGGPAVPTGLTCDLAPNFPLIVLLNAEAKCSSTGTATMNAGDRGFIVLSVDGLLGLASVLTLSAAVSVAP